MVGTKFYAYLIRDCHGGKVTGVVNELPEVVSIVGLNNPQGQHLCFEAAVSSMRDICDRNGLELIVEDGWHMFRATFES